MNTKDWYKRRADQPPAAFIAKAGSRTSPDGLRKKPTYPLCLANQIQKILILVPDLIILSGYNKNGAQDNQIQSQLDNDAIT